MLKAVLATLAMLGAAIAFVFHFNARRVGRVLDSYLSVCPYTTTGCYSSAAMASTIAPDVYYYGQKW